MECIYELYSETLQHHTNGPCLWQSPQSTKFDMERDGLYYLVETSVKIILQEEKIE